MRILGDLEPSRVFYYFEEICKIPHGSYNTKQISDYCVSVARGLGLEVRQDEWRNVIIRKPASKGCENAPVVMLQGHLDMVCEKEPDCIHDFDTEPLELMIQDGYVTANGTTLGGDDGIAVAIGLAILEDASLVHPPLEIVFTTEEEVGMDGALGLDTSDLQASYLLNLDSEDEGVLTVSCAGGSTMELHLPYHEDSDYDSSAAMKEGLVYEVKLTGLLGGHSGVEIHKGRANSNKLMALVLTGLNQEVNYHLLSVDGGFKHNAIPRETTAYIALESKQDIQKAVSVFERYQKIFQEAYADSDAGVSIEMQPCGVEYKVKNGHVKPMVLDADTKERLLMLLMLVPDGLQTMSQTISGLPESSLNLGILRTDMEANEIYVEISRRSNNPARLTLLEEHIRYCAKQCGFQYKLQSEYPGWSYRKDSRLQKVMVDVYREMFQKEMRVEAIHAGLECGIIASKLPNLDIVSTGPDILDIHTPQERLSIKSVKRTYAYILKVLEILAS